MTALLDRVSDLVHRLVGFGEEVIQASHLGAGRAPRMGLWSYFAVVFVGYGVTTPSWFAAAP